MMIRTDLHIHTQASDGTWTPRELVEQVRKKNLGLFAVTDHESVASVAETEALAQAAGIKFLRGVEISTTTEDMCFHVLGYGIDVGNQELLSLLAHNERLLLQKDEDSVELLQSKGWPISLEDYHNFHFEHSKGGFKALQYLISKGLCRDVNDFFGRIFTLENNLGFPTFPSIEEAIAAIHAAGGLAFLAHAASSFHGPGLAATLHYLSDKNFDGFECYHTSHSKEDTAGLLEYCRRHHKLISGGSDCHGDFATQRVLGRPEIYLEDLNLGGLLV